jgi:ParB family chromosome partitioning protein
MRSGVDPDQLAELRDSMRTVGLINPVTVRRNGSRWEIIAGFRRYLAAKLLQWQSLPCLVVDADIPGAEAAKAAENWCRANVDPVSEAHYLRSLKSRNSWTSTQLAKILGKPESWISERLAILDYDEELRSAVADGRVPFSAARELARISDHAIRSVYVHSAVTSGVTPAQAVRWKEEANRPPWEEPPQPDPQPAAPAPDTLKPIACTCDACRGEVALAFRKAMFLCPGCHADILNVFEQLKKSDAAIPTE